MIATVVTVKIQEKSLNSRSKSFELLYILDVLLANFGLFSVGDA